MADGNGSDKAIYTEAEFLALDITTLAVGFQAFVLDTGVTWEVGVAAGSTLPNVTKVWQAIGGTSASGWGKYVCAPASGGGVTQPDVLYHQLQAGIDAAFANGHTMANPAFVHALAGTFNESLTMRPGIFLVGLGCQDGFGVVVNGDVTFAGAADGDVASLCNVFVNGTIRGSGAHRQTLFVMDTRAERTDATAAIAWDNSDPDSLLVLRDATTISAGGGLGLEVTTSVTLVSQRTNYEGDASRPCVAVAGGQHSWSESPINGGFASVGGVETFVESPVVARGMSALTLTGADVTWLNGVLDGNTDPLVAGTGFFRYADLTRLGRFSVGAGITMVPLTTLRPSSYNFLLGPGPFNLATNTTLTLLVLLDPDVVKVVNLPNLQTQWADGCELTLLTVPGLTTGTALVVLQAAAGQTIGGTYDWYRLFAGGSVTLRATYTGGLLRWQVVAEVRGTPERLEVFADDTGDDANPGTRARPVRTGRVAMERAAVPWSDRGTVYLGIDGAPYTDDLLASSTSPVAYPGSSLPGAWPLRVVGGYEDEPAVTQPIAITGGAAGAAGPPVVFATATFAAPPAGPTAGSFALFAGGPLDGQRYVIDRATAGSIEVPALGLDPSTATEFRTQRASASLDASGPGLVFVPGPGATGIVFEGVDLCRSGQPLASRGGIVLLAGARSIGSLWSPDGVLSLGTAGTGTIGTPAATAWLADVIAEFYPTPGQLSSYLAGAQVGATGAVIGTESVAALLTVQGGTAGLDTCATGTGGPVGVDVGGRCELAAVMAFDEITFERGAVGVIDNLNAVQNSGDGLLVAENAVVEVTALQGTLTAVGAVGVRTHNGGRATVTDPNTGTTITGPGGVNDAVANGAAANVSWAAVAAANQIDLQELCAVGQ
ncbi:MAG TPA: hypothetical protein VHH11_13790 [Gammaproteobacteria bacterium]|nr:hypothetical protein [Gammaproteobacteria bacterium]